MLHKFPVEIALQTISNLPLQSLYFTALVSREWNALIVTNERVVYRNAAILHRFIDEGQLASGAESIIADLKDYCKRQLEIERGWRGKAPAVVQELTATGSMVHRIKVDYEHDFVITTCSMGGLFVCDIKSNRVLWALPPSHVDIFAHVEYDRGYMVFNRQDNCKEVWRHTIDADDDQPAAATSPPDQKMVDASTQAAARFHVSGSRRGHFKSWALLAMPSFCRWFRLSHPNLLAVSANEAYVWDITKSQLVSAIRDIQRRHQKVKLGATSYAEVNEKYVFICGSDGVRVFAREGGALLYQLLARDLPSAAWDVRPPALNRASGPTTSIIRPQVLRYNKRGPTPFRDTFMACHVSASGNDLAVLTTNGRLIILPGFQRLFPGSKLGTALQQDVAIILNFQLSPHGEEISSYLAVGSRNGKLAVATFHGVYIISPDIDFSRLTVNRPPKPGVSVCQLTGFQDERLLSLLSCLQITHDAVYFTYKPSERVLPIGTSTVYSVSF